MGVVTWFDNSLLSHDEWLHKRNSTIGASEVGTIVFGSKWSSSLEIWHNKVTGKIRRDYNLRMYIGTKTEQISADMWQYFDGDETSVIENDRLGKKVKMCKHINSTAFNSDFPFLSATPDRIIQPYGKYAGRGEGCLEIKNSMGVVMKSYESNLPTEYIIQLVTQMMCTDFKFGELFLFLDNRSLECHPIERKDTKKVEQVILSHTKKFWDSVLKARPIYNQICHEKSKYNMARVAELEVELAKCEPESQNSLGYLNYLTDLYKDRVNGIGIVTGTAAQLEIAKKHKKALAEKKAIEAKEVELKGQLVNILRENTVLDFGKSGNVSYYPNVKGNRLLKNNIK